VFVVLLCVCVDDIVVEFVVIVVVAEKLLGRAHSHDSNLLGQQQRDKSTASDRMH
jgi:hypothetical protein